MRVVTGAGRTWRARLSAAAPHPTGGPHDPVREIAEACSGHRFRDAYAALAPDDRAAAADVVGRYVDADGVPSVVSTCDVHEFRDGLVTAITSYAVEPDPVTQG